jgi:transcriptional regulator of acetoin/glycerol metabolism
VLRKNRTPELSADESLLPLAEVRRTHVLRVLEKVEGNKAQAAKILGINRATLYRLLKEGFGEEGLDGE